MDELEARSGPNAKRCLSMHSSEGAVSEGGDFLDSLSLQDFQGSASDEVEEEGAASGEEKEYTWKDVAVALKKRNAEFERSMAEMQANMDGTVKECPPR